MRPGQYNVLCRGGAAPVVPATYENVLGTKLLEYWTVKVGASGSSTMTSWTGQKLGVVLSPFNTTTYSTDGSNFNSLKVLNTTNAAINSMRNTSTAIGTASTVATTVIVGRNRGATAAQSPLMTYTSNNYIGYSIYASTDGTNPNLITGYRYASTGVAAGYGNGNDLLVHMHEIGFTSTTGVFTYRDGVIINNSSTSGYPTGPTGQITNVQIGGDSNWFAVGSNWAIAMVMLIDGPMTAGERAGMYSIAKADFNLP